MTAPKMRLVGSIKNASFPRGYRPKSSKHLIDEISYSKDYVVCTCAWKGPVDEYQPHRKEERKNEEAALSRHSEDSGHQAVPVVSGSGSPER